MNLPFLHCLTLYLRAIFQVQAPRLGGLYLEGLVHGGAYFRNFTVFLSSGTGTRDEPLQERLRGRLLHRRLLAILNDKF